MWVDGGWVGGYVGMCVCVFVMVMVEMAVLILVHGLYL